MTTTNQQGLSVDILRPADGSDCTNGGVSSRATSAILVGEGVPEIFSPRPGVPVLRLVIRWRGTPNEYMHAEPVEAPAGKVGPMFGGNFIKTSDSRFPSRYPIPIHDRYDTAEDYDYLSR